MTTQTKRAPHIFSSPRVFARWLFSYFYTAFLVLTSTVILVVPFVPFVWLLWNWIAPRFGLPVLSFLEAAGLLFLLRFLQPSVALVRTQPEPERNEVDDA